MLSILNLNLDSTKFLGTLISVCLWLAIINWKMKKIASLIVLSVIPVNSHRIMVLRESEEIRKSLKPIFVFTWVLGVPRVNYRYSYRIIYSIIVSVIYLATFSYTFDSRRNLARNFNTSMKIAYISSQFIMFSGGIGTILFWVLKGSRALEDVIIKMAELNVELKSLGMKVKHRGIFYKQIGGITVFFTLWVAIVIMHEYIIKLMGFNDDVPIFTSFCLAYSSHGPHLPILLGELVFSTIMYMFYQRFQWINQILRQISRDQEYSHHGRTVRVLPARNRQNLPIGKMNSREELLMKIERLYRVHQRLCGMAEEVNSSFSWQLYLAVSVTFILLIYRLLVLYSFAFLRLNRHGVRIGLNVVWVIYYILKCWMITLTCCNTCTEANKLGIMLHGVSINDERYHRMLREYSVYLHQNKLHFTASGFFAIDFTLVNTLFSQVTTFILFAVDVWTGIEKERRKITTVTKL